MSMFDFLENENFSLEETAMPFDCILLEELEVPEKTAGGIIIPDEKRAELEATVSSKRTRKVVKVGPDARSVQAGDHILFDPSGLAFLTIGDKQYNVVYESQVKLIQRKGGIGRDLPSNQVSRIKLEK